MITIALPKGRLMDETIDILKGVGIEVEIPSSRRLFFFDKSNRYRFLIVRAQDVATYVEYSAADLGIVGKDVLEETKSDVFELLDLGIGYCKMVVAGKEPECLNKKTSTVKVATKFVNIAKKHFLKKGMNAEIIKLYGSIELAPLLGIADCIVDIVSTGTTLKENGLSVIENIFESTAILVSNKISYYTKNVQIKEFLNLIK
ncbi:ATP phosphoribosyltransferase [Hippea maritima]|uniref:ATP phosphoribosyltransferase n=1 Tax=Hippea maritima (strain ATCC 700847 / DSM 10411 / MH2) TaxID=760142 RepID=F2LXL5_HIPMA|nr:ATP phosphoribosyltransferase [Hippea maritima]AEA33201.1 ATP phosphoribosyltransferase [Hippea maritima DSM 10411]